MIKDIPDLKVEDLCVAIAPRPLDVDAPEDELIFWDVFIINLRDETLKNLFVTSKAYGEIDGEKRQSSVFRQFFDEIESLGLIHLEPLHSELFVLTNEFWISFSLDGQMYDRKFLFTPGSLIPELFSPIPFTDRHGVLIR
jgi:hypothetical protein